MLSGGKTTIPYEKDTIPEKVAALYTANFHQFQNEVDALAAQTKNTNSINEWEVLKRQVESTRMAYKKIEFIFDYYQTSYNGTYINGAPLPKVNEYFEADNIIAPGGLQALDEAVFEPASDENLQHIQVLANALKERVDFIEKIHLPVQLKSSQIMECIRSGIVRIYTLGLTGYDTPGSVNGLKESYVAWESLETT